jgi:hypothetical protein
MTPILLLAPRLPPTPKSTTALDVFAAPANDEAAQFAASLTGFEELLVVSFVGLRPDEQLRALASFPGARRCIIADA